MDHDAKPTQDEPAPDSAAEQSRLDELVDEQGRESFPASDPPSTWAGEDTTGDH